MWIRDRSRVLAGISVEAAGEAYLKIVAPVNCAVTRLNKDQQAVGKLPAQWPHEAVTATVMPDYRIAGEAARQFAIDLRSGQWPAAVEQDIVTLADAATASGAVFLRAADASTPEAFLGIVQETSFIDTLDAAASAADVVRQKLNLESVYNQTDFCALAEQ